MAFSIDPKELDECTTYEQMVMTITYMAIGAASMCWSETPKGVFDNYRASEIAEFLIRELT